MPAQTRDGQTWQVLWYLSAHGLDSRKIGESQPGVQVEMEAAGSRKRVQYQLERSQQGLSSADKAAGPAAPVTPPELPIDQEDGLQVGSYTDPASPYCSTLMHACLPVPAVQLITHQLCIVSLLAQMVPRARTWGTHSWQHLCAGPWAKIQVKLPPASLSPAL